MPHQLISLLDRIAHSAPAPAPRDARKKFYDFRSSKQEYQHKSSTTAIIELQKLLWELAPMVQQNTAQATLLIDALQLSYRLERTDPEVIDQLRKIAEKLPLPSDRPIAAPRFSNIPAEIKSDIDADAQELERCFSAAAYRSCVVLCGRILETALHRKYFELTGQDILEKSPGIGLGNLIAKMKEKGISLDPALANQIHLINQVRVFSVHKKQEAFSPNRTQAQAIMLYTMDAVGKLFVG